MQVLEDQKLSLELWPGGESGWLESFSRIAPKLYLGSAVPFDHRVKQQGFDVVVLCADNHQGAIHACPVDTP